MLADFFGKYGGSVFGIVLVAVILFSAAYLLIRRRVKHSNLFMLIGALRKELESGQIHLRQEMPRSLSGLDRIYLPKIEKRFSDLNIEEFRGRAEALLLSVLEALEHSDVNLLYEAGPTYKEQIRQVIRDMKDSGQSLRVEKARIHKTVISAFKDTPSASEITFQTALEARIALLDKEGKVLQGSLDDLSQLRFEQTLIHVIDPDLYQGTEKTVLTVNCPHCGATLNSQRNTCAYCGSHVDFIPVRIWLFSRLKRT